MRPHPGVAGGRMPAMIDRARLQDLLDAELARFRSGHPRSAALHERAQRSLLGGVPMPWMRRWAGGYPVGLAEARGSRVRTIDGQELVDLCLGDTGAMTGHSPPVVAELLRDRAARGITAMLPTEDAVWAGEDLTRRFG